ncbi:MAG: phosphoribosylformylglycinamidine synthase subunit PurS [Acidobacteriota bacterium]
MRVEVHVTLKPAVLDVQGKAVQGALHSLGHDAVTGLRQGKYFTFDLGSTDRAGAEAAVKDMCEKLLSNPVIEDFTYELQESA